MTPKPHEKANIVFLFSDTGGGHRSGAEAIIEGLQELYPDQFVVDMVDIFRDYAPRPLNLAPDVYPTLSRMPELWDLSYRITDEPRRTRLFYTVLYPYVRRSIHRLLREHPCDLIVSVHPLCNIPALRALRKRSVPYITVVLDMVSSHAAWFDPRGDLVIVATEAARQRGLAAGLAPEQIKVIGMPVSRRFARMSADKAELRTKLGWPQDQPVLLVVGGGEGMGPLEETVKAIDQRMPQASMAIVCGRNHKLLSRLEKYNWFTQPYLYGFVRDMPNFMDAADILVTKAGPGTISEAFIAGLPIVLYSRMPGQEEGNVDYVVQEGAGVWAPEPEQAADAVMHWLQNPQERAAVAQISRNLARPNASLEIAQLLGKAAGLPH